jgi:hypothetical protein
MVKGIGVENMVEHQLLSEGIARGLEAAES